MILHKSGKITRVPDLFSRRFVGNCKFSSINIIQFKVTFDLLAEDLNNLQPHAFILVKCNTGRHADTIILKDKAVVAADLICFEGNPDTPRTSVGEGMFI